MASRKKKEFLLAAAVLAFNAQIPFVLSNLKPIELDIPKYLVAWASIFGAGFILYKTTHKIFEKYFPNNFLVKFLYIALNVNNVLKVKKHDFTGYFVLYSALNILIMPAAYLIKFLYFTGKTIYLNIYGTTNGTNK